MKITRRAALKSSALAASALALRGPRLFSQASSAVDAHIDILPGEPIATISPEIYSHFIEHLGGVIYDGVWVGPESKIANTNGIRQAFIDTMRAIRAPLLRWPGGCFADSYDWRDGLGAADKRPARTGFWGQQDPNRFGLHEFMHTCRAIDASRTWPPICARCPRATSPRRSSTATRRPGWCRPTPPRPPRRTRWPPSALQMAM